jgi:type II secretory pathway component PulJ
MRYSKKTGGFTLAEVLVASAVTCCIFGAMLVSTAALRRSFEAANYHVTAQNDQLRVVDYLGRDLRSASSVTIRDSGTRVELQVPTGNSSSLALHLNLPLLGTLQTASPSTAARTINYFLEGDRLVREDNGRQMEIAKTLTSFQVSRSGSRARMTMTFSPRFSRSPTAAAQSAAQVEATVFLRNASGS